MKVIIVGLHEDFPLSKWSGRQNPEHSDVRFHSSYPGNVGRREVGVLKLRPHVTVLQSFTNLEYQGTVTCTNSNGPGVDMEPTSDKIRSQKWEG